MLSPQTSTQEGHSPFTRPVSFDFGPNSISYTGNPIFPNRFLTHATELQVSPTFSKLTGLHCTVLHIKGCMAEVRPTPVRFLDDDSDVNKARALKAKAKAIP